MSISCLCGKVSFTLTIPIPVYRIECGCVDCRQALEYAASKGRPPAPTLPDLWYFKNDSFQSKGSYDDIIWAKLREKGSSVRCMSKCCNSTLLVHHPFYRDNLTMVFEQTCEMENIDDEAIPHPKIRSTMKDFPKDLIGGERAKRASL